MILHEYDFVAIKSVFNFLLLNVYIFFVIKIVNQIFKIFFFVLLEQFIICKVPVEKPFNVYVVDLSFLV